MLTAQDLGFKLKRGDVAVVLNQSVDAPPPSGISQGYNAWITHPAFSNVTDVSESNGYDFPNFPKGNRGKLVSINTRNVSSYGRTSIPYTLKIAKLVISWLS